MSPPNAQGLTMRVGALFPGSAETPGRAVPHRCLAAGPAVQEGRAALPGAGELPPVLPI